VELVVTLVQAQQAQAVTAEMAVTAGMVLIME
jgi:hypothetical protein